VDNEKMIEAFILEVHQ